MSTAQVISFPSSQPLVLSKKQLATRLDRSTRWVELRVAEGMPSLPGTDRFGGRRFDVGAVEAWLAAGKERPSPLMLLEARVSAVEAQLRERSGRDGLSAG